MGHFVQWVFDRLPVTCVASKIRAFLLQNRAQITQRHIRKK